jgi:hypothetical protein
MPAERMSMRRVREILRLKHECGASNRAIAVATGVARGTVRLCPARVFAAGLNWPLPALVFAPDGMSDPDRRGRDKPGIGR